MSSSPPPAPAAQAQAKPITTEPSTNGSVPDTFAPIPCTVRVVKDSANRLQGSLVGQIAPQGLILYPKAGDPTVIKPGSKVKYLGDNRMSATLPAEGDGPPRDLSLRLRRGAAYQSLMTLDTVAFLNGDISKMSPSYAISPWLFLPALLPLGLPVMIYLMQQRGLIKLDGQGYQLAMTSTVIAALVLALLCIAFALSEKTKAYLRVLAAILFTLLAYGFTAIAAGAVAMPDVYSIIGVKSPEEKEAINWQSQKIPELNCTIVSLAPMTQEPDSEREVLAGEKAKFTRYAMRNRPEIIYTLESAPASKAVQESYLRQAVLHERDLKGDFPEATDIKRNEIVNPCHSKGPELKWEAIPGSELVATLPGNLKVTRHIFVLKDRIYVLTTQGTKPNYQPYLEQQYMRNLTIDGMAPKNKPKGTSQ